MITIHWELICISEEFRVALTYIWANNVWLLIIDLSIILPIIEVNKFTYIKMNTRLEHDLCVSGNLNYILHQAGLILFRLTNRKLFD